MRTSRQHIYRLSERYRQDGLDAVDPRSRRPASNPNAVADEVIMAIERTLVGACPPLAARESQLLPDGRATQRHMVAGVTGGFRGLGGLSSRVVAIRVL